MVMTSKILAIGVKSVKFTMQQNTCKRRLLSHHWLSLILLSL
jgi:hypothetical protein